MNLPYSMKRGEVVSFQTILYNYMDVDVVANVTLHNEDHEFEFIDVTNLFGQATTSREKLFII